MGRERAGGRRWCIWGGRRFRVYVSLSVEMSCLGLCLSLSVASFTFPCFVCCRSHSGCFGMPCLVIEWFGTAGCAVLWLDGVPWFILNHSLCSRWRISSTPRLQVALS
jgi:hypothetical protein